MKLLLSIIVGFFILGTILGISITAYAQQNQIPAWIKTTAGFWVDDQISDDEFISALQYLVEQEILVIPEKESTNIITETETESKPDSSTFPDPQKDPRYYLKRYYTEPTYKAWYDRNYPNVSIEEKVGYDKKIVTDDYYVNSFFDIAIKPPEEWEIKENSPTVDPELASIVSFSSPRTYSEDEYHTGFNIHYFNGPTVNEILLTNPDLVDYFEPIIYFEEASQTKLKDASIEKTSWGYIIHYWFNDVNYFPEQVIDDVTYPETYLTLQNEYVVFLLNNGDRYDIIFSSMPNDYSISSKEFNASIDTFHVGEVEYLDSILNYDNS